MAKSVRGCTAAFTGSSDCGVSPKHQGGKSNLCPVWKRSPVQVRTRGDPCRNKMKVSSASCTVRRKLSMLSPHRLDHFCGACTLAVIDGTGLSTLLAKPHLFIKQR